MVLEIFLKYWKPLAVLLVAVALFIAGVIEGRSQVQAKWNKATAAQEKADLREEVRQADVTAKEVIKYVDRVKIVREKAQTIIKEVPIYVTEKADADCIIPVGFVRLHDAAATNTLPDGLRDTDASPSHVVLSAVAETIADNYGACHENTEQLIALQSWIRGISSGRNKVVLLQDPS